MVKRSVGIVVVLSVIANLVLIAYLIGSKSLGGKPITNAPILLERIQAIGKLHTVRHTFERTGSVETFAEPNEGVAWIPGAESLVHGLTKNTVVMTIRGSVESGIDFKRVKLDLKEGTAHVSLPRPETFEPNVTAELHDSRSGALWRDDEIQLKAIEAAKTEFRSAAIKMGAPEQAIVEAKRVIGELLKTGGVKEVVFDEKAGA